MGRRPGSSTAWAGQWSVIVGERCGGVVPTSYRFTSTSQPVHWREHRHHHTVPDWPSRPGRRTITLELDTEHVQHLDTQASYEGCSRAAYVRRLIVRDVERQGPARRRARATGQD